MLRKQSKTQKSTTTSRKGNSKSWKAPSQTGFTPLYITGWNSPSSTWLRSMRKVTKRTLKTTLLIIAAKRAKTSTPSLAAQSMSRANSVAVTTCGVVGSATAWMKLVTSLTT